LQSPRKDLRRKLNYTMGLIASPAAFATTIQAINREVNNMPREPPSPPYISSSDEERERKKAKVAQKIVWNISRSLSEISKREHQSGLFKAVLSLAVGSNVNNSEVARMLHVDRRSVAAARSFKFDRKRSNYYVPVVVKPDITRQRIPNDVQHDLLDWLLSQFTPSSNSANVIRKKVFGDMFEQQVKTWRTDTKAELFTLCRRQLPHVAVSPSYFFSLIPWYVRMKPLYSGLCPHHHAGNFFVDLYKMHVNIWHRDCQCSCIYCTTCQHGANPLGDGIYEKVLLL
jgi:hypothetical protein